MSTQVRPDLGERQIAVLIAATVAAWLILLVFPGAPRPGSPTGQSCAFLGTLLLLAPALFSFNKRSASRASPPAWFVAHVLATLAGSILIFLHASAGNWLSPPGLLLAVLAFLLLQGSLMRAFIARGFSLLFARSSQAFGFGAPAGLDRDRLQDLIDAKIALLVQLDPGADEALFSPALRHWLQKPLTSLRYQMLAEREARMIGARAGAGAALAWARRLHMLAALVFYLGLLAHVVVVLFFAGYAAGGGTVDWWHISNWGGPR